MPIPKIESPDQVRLNDKPAKVLVQVVKPYKTDMRDIASKLVELAAKAKQEEGT